MPNRTRTKSKRGQAGFSVLDTLIGAVILAIALLGHVASTIAEDAMAREGQVRSEALQLVRQFTERMRADDEWEQLYESLRETQVLAESPAALSGKGVSIAYLPDGRAAVAPTWYYTDLVLPERVSEIYLLVEVPSVEGTLREDQKDASFGLPCDLNGDGEVDDQPHQADYRVLPVRFRFTWNADGLGQRECVLTTWMGLVR